VVVHQDDGILGPAVGALQPAGQLRLGVHHHPAAAPPVTQEQEVAIYGVHEVVVDPPEGVGGEGEEEGEL